MDLAVKNEINDYFLHVTPASFHVLSLANLSPETLFCIAERIKALLNTDHFVVDLACIAEAFTGSFALKQKTILCAFFNNSENKTEAFRHLSDLKVDVLRRFLLLVHIALSMSEALDENGLKIGKQSDENALVTKTAEDENELLNMAVFDIHAIREFNRVYNCKVVYYATVDYKISNSILKAGLKIPFDYLICELANDADLIDLYCRYKLPDGTLSSWQRNTDYQFAEIVLHLLDDSQP